jgi:hypothetical protein
LHYVGVHDPSAAQFGSSIIFYSSATDFCSALIPDFICSTLFTRSCQSRRNGNCRHSANAFPLVAILFGHTLWSLFHYKALAMEEKAVIDLYCKRRNLNIKNCIDGTLLCRCRVFFRETRQEKKIIQQSVTIQA